MAWGVPLVMASLPLFSGYYGPAGAWCWITGNHVAWRFGIWYVPLFTLIFLMICCYARIIYVANERMQSWFGTFNPERERRKVSLAEEIKPLKWYPSVYLLVSLFPLINRTMTQHTSRLCKGSLTKKESDGVLHQMTWPTQSPDLNPIEVVWDELDRRVKEKQLTSPQHMRELLQDFWKSIPGEAGWENAKSVQIWHQGKW
uniref:G-protein coupled receptors family 2 profile 2 domain-containing protein n=1 Tax=Oncorhynchus tshawytscha TaxID=74940 RepID=A0AAZ3S383_ONCTS